MRLLPQKGLHMPMLLEHLNAEESHYGGISWLIVVLFGYHPNVSKMYLAAKQGFRYRGICRRRPPTAKRNLGAALGSKTFTDGYKKCRNGLKTLAEAAS